MDASVGGKSAQIGARLIDSTAKKLADEFFAKFSALAAAKASDHKASASDAQPKAHASLETSMTQNQASATVTPILGKNTWIIGALVVVVIVIVAVVYIFGY